MIATKTSKSTTEEANKLVCVSVSNNVSTLQCTTIESMKT